MSRGAVGLEAQRKKCWVPLLRNVWIRTGVGLAVLLASMLVVGVGLGERRLVPLVAVSVASWLVSVLVTDKYTHKYPRRYNSYLLASHAKAAIVMALVLAVLGWVAGPAAVPQGVLWVGFALFILVDALASAFRRRQTLDEQPQVEDPSPSAEGASAPDTVPCPIDKQAVLDRIRSDLSGPVVEFVEQNLPDAHGGNDDVLVLDRVPAAGAVAKTGLAGLVVGQPQLNSIYHLNDYLLLCARSVAMGGYVVVRYAPLEGVAARLRSRYGGVFYWPASALHFLWYQALPKTPLLGAVQYIVTRKGNRTLSRAEVWGRLSYCGMHVIAESGGERERYVIAQRVALPVQGRRPSYYPIIALEKVGLDGKIMHVHKLRSMFPYSEFLQKRIYEEHGLTSTGKFANDFRITAFGKFVRRYWLDELPGILDWLRGDIKLVGMRATSPQYLSLYPKEVIDLYVQVKPGLVPPIFDESTNGFDRIVEVESAYLRRYRGAPVRTDVEYFLRTFWDIFRGGVRGK